MKWDEANEVTVRVSWRVPLPSAFLTSDISARSLRHSTLIPPPPFSPQDDRVDPSGLLRGQRPGTQFNLPDFFLNMIEAI